jgi:hypothetical protein
MSGRPRDWDKVGRERRAYLHGSLPVWQTEWGPYRPDEPRQQHIPSVTSGQRSRPPQPEDHMPGDVKRWRILTIDLRECPVAVPRSASKAHEVRYTCIGLANPTRDRLVRELFNGFRPRNWNERMTKFIASLHSVGHFRRAYIIGGCVVYEFTTAARNEKIPLYAPELVGSLFADPKPGPAGKQFVQRRK